MALEVQPSASDKVLAVMRVSKINYPQIAHWKTSKEISLQLDLSGAIVCRVLNDLWETGAIYRRSQDGGMVYLVSEEGSRTKGAAVAATSVCFHPNDCSVKPVAHIFRGAFETT